MCQRLIASFLIVCCIETLLFYKEEELCLVNVCTVYTLYTVGSMYILQGHSQGGPRVPVDPPSQHTPFVRYSVIFLNIKQHTNLIIQVAKKRESKESACRKSFLVLHVHVGSQKWTTGM